MLTPGLRIVRGPDWTWGNQDGGEGFVGTVCEIALPTRGGGSSGYADQTVVVQWDNGTRTNYRVGYMGKYDLRVIDNAQIGVKHPNIMCNACYCQGISGMRYKCTVCHDFDLCYMCYHGDEHDVTHSFKRFDTATSTGVILPPRQGGRKCRLQGIFAEAKVVRGFDWEWDNQDGGDGKLGRVIDIRGWDKESHRSVANVYWFAGSTNVYRLGHKGICDIKFVEPSFGGNYYPEHLPILRQNTESPAPKPVRNGPSHFGVGDKVQVVVSEEQLKAMQQGHGGWNPRMAEHVGKIGTVHRVTDKGDIRVQYEGCNNRWTLNPSALRKVNSFNVGDVVTLIDDIEKVKQLQKGHGEWIDNMKNVLGKFGRVLKVYSDGDLRVQLDGCPWTLNPQCVRVVPGSATELANTMNADQNKPQDHTIHMNQGAGNAGDDTTASLLIRAAAQGQVSTVAKLLNNELIEARSNGKTALQVASHQGHVNVVRLLLRAGASVDAADNDGDTCLHYAAFGNQPEVTDLLLKSGANVNVANRSGCTALHVAAHKQPGRCAELLLAAGANPNLTDLYGDTALHDAIGKDCFPVTDLLCRTSGTDFTLRNKRGFNVLHHAALKGKNIAVKHLLRFARQLVDVKKDDGFSALHLAALNGHRDVVETLIKNGRANIDLRNNRQQTALLLAAGQGHCDVIELMIGLNADINAVDEDLDSALHIVLIKRSEINTEVSSVFSPGVYAIFQQIPDSIEHRTAIALACFLIQRGINVELTNSEGQKAFDLLPDSATKELLKRVVPSVSSSFSVRTRRDSDDSLPNLDCLSLNLTETPPKSTRLSRKPSRSLSADEHGSPRHKNSFTWNDDMLNNTTECHVCSEVSEENVTLEPCGHKPACEDCSARMKKCLICSELVQRRLTKDGRTIGGKSRQSSAERMKYLESKIREIEESHACSICMERKKNVVFFCGHGTCDKCADTLTRCHMCRKPIDKKIHIY